MDRPDANVLSGVRRRGDRAVTTTTETTAAELTDVTTLALMWDLVDDMLALERVAAYLAPSDPWGAREIRQHALAVGALLAD